jgi:hypothetical protein
MLLYIKKLLKLIIRKRCEFLLITLVGRKLAKQWWQSPNKAFEGKTPEERWEENPEDVYDYLTYYVSK